MELSMDDHQKTARATAAALADTLLLPDAARLDREERFPTAALKALGSAGLLGVNIAPQYGGLGAGVTGYVLAVNELAQRCGATTVAMMVTNMVAEAIEKYGDASQRQQFLPALRNGDWPAYGFSLSEPGSGSDAASLKTTAQRTDGGYILNGVKSWVTSGGHCGVYLVMAATDSDLKARGISAFLVTPDTPGFTVTKPEEKLGLRGSATTQLVFEECFIPAEQRLGEEGIGFRIAMNSLDGGRVGVSAQACGIAQAALNVGIDWLAQRRESPYAAQWTRLIAESQAELDGAWLLCTKAAYLKDEGRPLTREAASSKLFCTEAANRICGRMLEILGPDGCDERYLVERLVRDVRVTRIYEGTSEVQRIVIAREVLRGFASGGR
ncbi:MAG: acyl-CoA dehydrogenase [Myxococcales bacterium]|nr:acyl-CoA dehydrogenase [Myxococcales bacterium]